jgi:osmotically inducible protein OsmC
MEKEEIGWTIKKIKLHLEAAVPGISTEKFAELAAIAEKNCPVSRLLNCDIQLEARLSP